MSVAFFGIYTDNFELRMFVKRSWLCWLDALVSIVIILLLYAHDSIIIILILYAHDIIVIAQDPCDLNNHLRNLKDFFSSMGMTMNMEKINVIIIKNHKITSNTFTYENNSLKEVPVCKYIGINVHHKIS